MDGLKWMLHCTIADISALAASSGHRGRASDDEQGLSRVGPMWRDKQTATMKHVLRVHELRVWWRKREVGTGHQQQKQSHAPANAMTSTPARSAPFRFPRIATRSPRPLQAGPEIVAGSNWVINNPYEIVLKSADEITSNCRRIVIIYSVGAIKYSTRDLTFDVNYRALLANQRYGSESVIDVSAPFLHQFALVYTSLLDHLLYGSFFDPSFHQFLTFQLRFDHLHLFYPYRKHIK